MSRLEPEARNADFIGVAAADGAAGNIADQGSVDMPSQEQVEAFIAQVVSGDHVGAIRDWYAEDAWMQENQGARRVGRETLMAHEARALARVLKVDTERLEPPMIQGDRVAIRWRFTFVPREGPSTSLEEVAWQTWRDGRIVEEVFFYDPRQIGG